MPRLHRTAEWGRAWVTERLDDVAAFLVERLGPLQARRLQALVYYAQAWQLALQHEPLFDDVVEAWPRGPVVRRLDGELRGGETARTWVAGDAERLDPRTRALLAWVVDLYGSFSGEELARVARAEAPWLLTRGNRRRGRPPIDPAVMADYYGRLGTSPTVAVAVATGSARLEGHEFGPHMATPLLEAAEGTRPLGEIIAEIALRHQPPSSQPPNHQPPSHQPAGGQP